MKPSVIFKALLATIVTIAIIFVAHTFGLYLTNNVLLFLLFLLVLLILMEFILVLNLSVKEGKKLAAAHNVKVSIHKMAISPSAIKDFLATHTNVPQLKETLAEMNAVLKLKEFAELNAEQQVMKSEENALRTRLTSTVDFVLSNDFKAWSEEKKRALLIQLGAMVIYHSTLLNRCKNEGMLTNE